MAEVDGNSRAMAVHPWLFALLLQFVASASVYASPFPAVLCQENYHGNERFVNTSLTLELSPSSIISGPCKHIFETAPAHGLIVRLHPITTDEKTNKNHFTSLFGGGKNMHVGQRMRNTTSSGSCPMNIYQISTKPSIPWRLDPCEMNGSEEEASKLLTPPLRIVWQHSHNRPNYKLTLTAYGEGEECEKADKHACLRIGQKKHICISDQLLCDGVQNCPVGPSFESDESEAACEEMRKRSPQWMIVLQGVLSQFVPKLPGLHNNNNNNNHNQAFNRSDPNESGSSSAGSHDGETMTKTTTSISMGRRNKTIFVETVIDTSSNIRKNFPKGLSQYGPWGYLMLGMLLCGGALLFCGLWECCCRKQKPVDPLTAGSLEAGSAVMDVNTVSRTFSAMQHDIHQRSHSPEEEVINYDETEPPPSYAVLFPNQKSTEDLPNATINE